MEESVTLLCPCRLLGRVSNDFGGSVMDLGSQKNANTYKLKQLSVEKIERHKMALRYNLLFLYHIHISSSSVVNVHIYILTVKCIPAV